VIFAAGCATSKTAVGGEGKDTASVSEEGRYEAVAAPAPEAEADAKPVSPVESPPPEASEPKSTVTLEDSVAVDAELRKPSGGKKRAPLPSSPPRESYRPSSAGVKAGAADDNLQFAAFLEFLEENKNLGLYNDISRRLIVSVSDAANLPLADARVAIYSGDKVLVARRTYADGRAMIFASEQAFPSDARLVIEAGGKKIRNRPGTDQGPSAPGKAGHQAA